MTDAILPQYIDSTMVSCFRSCPQKFYKEFVLGLRPASVSIDLHAGGAFAAGLETVYREVFLNKAPQHIAMARGLAAYLNYWGDFVIPEFKETPKTKDRVWEAIEEYTKQWPPATDHVQPYIVDGTPAFEFTFGIPLEPTLPHDSNGKYYHYETRQELESQAFPLHPSGDPFIYSGRFDMLGSWSNKPVVRDEKTTTSIGAKWAEKWDLRSQFLGYCWACQQSGLAVDTVIVRGVGILKTKFTLVEAIKVFADWELARWHEQLRRDLWRLRRAWDEGYFDFNLAESCEAYGGCAFHDVCKSPHPERWESQYVVRRWNPLQKNPIAEAA